MTSSRNAVKVGIASFLMIVAISALLIWKSGVLLRAAGYELIGEFSDVGGLLTGAEVRYRGYKVGQIFHITPSPTGVRVHFRVKTYVKVPKGSSLKVLFDGLIGEKYLAILPNPDSSDIIKEGTVLPGTSSLGLATFVDIGTQNLQITREIVDSFRKIIATEESSQTLKKSLKRLDEIMDNLAILTKEIADISQESSLKKALRNMQTITETLTTFTHNILQKGQADKEILSVIHDAGLLSKTIREMTQKVQQEIVTENMFRSVKSSITNIEKLTEKLLELFPEKTSATGNALFKQAGSFVSTLSSMEIKPQSSFEYAAQERLAYYALGLDIRFPAYFYRIGIGNRLQTETKFLHFQYGIPFSSYFQTRYGLFYTHPGAGIDFIGIPGIRFSLELFNPNKVELDLNARLHLIERFDLTFSAKNDPAKSSGIFHQYLIGISGEF